MRRFVSISVPGRSPANIFRSLPRWMNEDYPRPGNAEMNAGDAQKAGGKESRANCIGTFQQSLSRY